MMLCAFRNWLIGKLVNNGTVCPEISFTSPPPRTILGEIYLLAAEMLSANTILHPPALASSLRPWHSHACIVHTTIIGIQLFFFWLRLKPAPFNFMLGEPVQTNPVPTIDHLRNRQKFDLNKSRQKSHHSLKEHHKISNIPKFHCEML